MALKENYKDDILDVSVNTKRKYRMTENTDGTISLEDETVYTQEGDSFGASDLNAMAHAINNTSSDAEHTSYDNTESGLQATNVQDAVDEINDNLTQTPIEVGGETLSTIDEKLNCLIENLVVEIPNIITVSSAYNSASQESHLYTQAYNLPNYEDIWGSVNVYASGVVRYENDYFQAKGRGQRQCFDVVIKKGTWIIPTDTARYYPGNTVTIYSGNYPNGANNTACSLVKISDDDLSQQN